MMLEFVGSNGSLASVSHIAGTIDIHYHIWLETRSLLMRRISLLCSKRVAKGTK